MGACAGAGTAEGSKMLCERAAATTMPETHTDRETYTQGRHTYRHIYIYKQGRHTLAHTSIDFASLAFTFIVVCALRFLLPSALCLGFGLGPFWAWRYFRLFAVGSEFALNFCYFCFVLDFLFPDFALLLRHFDGASDDGDDDDDDDDACSAPTMLSS